jgi:peptide methionine sulfoxide reductase MsrB
MSTKVVRTDQGWRKQLTPHQYDLLHRKATNPAFSGEYAALDLASPPDDR